MKRNCFIAEFVQIAVMSQLWLILYANAPEPLKSTNFEDTPSSI